MTAITIDLRSEANAFPLSWFDDPGLTETTRVHIGADGRIVGHFTHWAQQSWEPGPPRSASGYLPFHRWDLTTCGTTMRVGLLADTPDHAPMHSGPDEIDALQRHIAAAVRVGEDAHGIWIAGAAAPYVAESCANREWLSVSGHWKRQDTGGMELLDLVLVDGPEFERRESAARFLARMLSNSKES